MAFNFSDKKSKGLRSISLTVIGLVILAFLGLNLAKSLQSNHEVNNEISDLQGNIKNLEKNNLELKELIEYFNSNAYIEEKARIDLGLKKTGENVVVVSNQREQGFESAGASASTKTLDEMNNVEKWWVYFFN